MYKIDNLVMDKLDLGKSAGVLHNNSIILSINNASATVTGSYEAYTFWTTTGNLTLDLAGSLHVQVGWRDLVGQQAPCLNHDIKESRITFFV